jgi:hypothetical protein
MKSIMFEIVGSVTNPDLVEQGQIWTTHLEAQLVQDDAPLKTTYIMHTPTDSTSQQGAYGSKWEELVQLKRKYDPSGVFGLATPTIPMR